MQRLGRAAASLLRHHREITADVVRQVERAQCACLCDIQGSLASADRSQPSSRQVLHVHNQAGWSTSGSADSSNSSSSSSSSSFGSRAWSSSRIDPWQHSLQLHHPHRTQHHAAAHMPSSSSSSTWVRPFSTQSATVNPLHAPAPPQVPAAAAEQVQQQAADAVAAPAKPLEGVCKRRNVKCGWKKLDFVLRMIRRSTVDDAMAQLSAHPKRAAVFVMHAVANARNNAIYAGGDPDKLYVAEAFVTRGKVEKRTHFMSKGFASIKETHFSHLNVRVAQMDEETAARVTLRRRPRLVAPIMQRMQHGKRTPRRLLAKGAGSSGGQQQLAAQV